VKPLDIRWSQSTASTNKLGMDAISAHPWTVWVTDHQTAGRGRLAAGRRRTWVDSPGECLLMSVVVEPRVPLAAAARLTLVAGVAVAETLAAASGVDVRLKWPNDLLVGGRKLCGILVESQGGGTSVRAVIGMGINVNNDPGVLDDAIVATSLRAETGQRFDRMALLTGVVGSLRQAMTLFERNGGELGELRNRWEARADVAGRGLRMAGRDGTALGLAQDGSLRVRWRDGAESSIDSGVIEWATH
jgi:BirA family transcriptional regulator, biotin operon repressor / biotin---[acetyl-CoA-carboxylase] ligase